MGKNIALLYMSAYFAQPAPEGSKNRFLRTQTNEAAVSALWKDPASRPDKIVALCKNRCVVFAGSEIYGGLANTWDYGPLGVELKNNNKKARWKKFVQENPYTVEQDAAIL